MKDRKKQMKRREENNRKYLIDTLCAERIEFLIDEKQSEKSDQEKDEEYACIEQLVEMLGSLRKEERNFINQYLEDLNKDNAILIDYIYRCGIKDGIKLNKMIENENVL